MYRVIDIISYNETWTFRYPHLAKRGNGLMVLLDPEQINEAPDLSGRAVWVESVNGDRVELVVDDVEVHGSVVGLFFRGVTPNEIRPHSHIDW
jgi:hypothetical protein